MTQGQYLQYQTKSADYLYCSDTNEIFCKSPSPSVDCYPNSNLEQMELSEGRQCIKVDGIDDILCIEKSVIDNLPPSFLPGDAKPKPSGVSLYGQVYTFEKFLRDFSRLLTIELTRKCNLRCEYCGFGKHYSRYRYHGTETIKSEIAQKAIVEHLSKKHSRHTITFYGGEPLLEFELLRELVLFAKKFTVDAALPKPKFSITTNATLLTDEIIHFLVEHDFSVLLSIDGDRETHNRFRVFREDRQGSYDIVERHLWRFVELYPNYLKRGLSVTTTACTDYRQTNEFLKEVAAFYPTLIINSVNSFLGEKEYITTTPACEHAGCIGLNDVNRHQVPVFLDWTNDRREKWQACYKNFKTTLMHSWDQTHKDWPIFYNNFLQRMLRIHKRKVTKNRSIKLACACLPGAVRLFCDVNGNYYPCERVETSNEHLQIGNVWTGVDASKTRDLIDYMINATNCSNCMGKHLCTICPSSITKNTRNEISDTEIQRHCNTHAQTLTNDLVDYTTVMELYPEKLDSILESGRLAVTNEREQDWLDDLFFYVPRHKNNM